MCTLEPVKAEPAEMQAVADFIERVIAESVDASPAEKNAFVSNTRSNLAKCLLDPSASFHVCARAGTELVGVVLVRDHWNLCHLFVAPDWQGRGIGRMMLEAAHKACIERGTRGYIRLNAARNAVGFYKKMGFTQVPDAPAAHQGMQFERRL
jgi:ribosomal protein S18 acetylase RimI-like enzyme